MLIVLKSAWTMITWGVIVSTTTYAQYLDEDFGSKVLLITLKAKR